MSSPRSEQFVRGLQRALLALLLLAGGDTLHANAVSKEYHLKAAFLFNFLRFVEWPPERFAEDASPIVIGILGPNPFDAELEELVRGRQVNGRRIHVRAVSVDEARSAHLIFVPAGEEGRFADALKTLRETAVVTVGESDRFAAQDGMIRFVRVADNLRFAINQAAAEAAGLRISSQLLKLATEVRRKK